LARPGVLNANIRSALEVALGSSLRLVLLLQGTASNLVRPDVFLTRDPSYDAVVSNPPDDPLPLDLRALEREARQHPDSESSQSRLLYALCTSELHGHPRRIEVILDFISRFPRSSEAKCPFVHVDPGQAPEAFKSIEALWSQLRNDHPNDPDLAIGHAAFVASEDRARSADILRVAIALLPKDAALWTELGRIAPEPSERLDALQKARALGSDQPNLLVWIGRAAVDAGRSDDVFKAGCELRTRMSQTRDAIHFPIDWTDTGRGAWARVRAVLEHSPDRQQLIRALTQYANGTHWSHTFLGLAAAEEGQLVDACKHLLSSPATWGEHRLSAYGPSFLLARKLCGSGMWKEVEQYLHACKGFWDDEILDDWIQEVRKEHIPDFIDE
jgi:hypothetical protein